MQVKKIFSTIDTHVLGEVFRIIIESPIALTEINQSFLEEKYKREVEWLLNEPRGHRGMNGCFVLPSKVADYALMFVNHDSDVQFKYSGFVASITALLETGNLAKKEDDFYDIETVNGVFTVYAKYENQVVSRVRFENKACKVVESTNEFDMVEVDGSRKYLIYELPESIASIHMESLSTIMRWGKQTREKTRRGQAIFDGITLVDSMDSVDGNIQSVTFGNDGYILRSPGVDSTVAIFAALLNRSGQSVQLTNQSIYGSKLTVQLVPGTRDRFYIETQGFITGMHQFIYDQEDHLENGFLLK